MKYGYCSNCGNETREAELEVNEGLCATCASDPEVKKPDEHKAAD